ncbi:L30e-like protein [Neocallimastix lanati (nom. inval.)]|jgi:H/ACA ribonucleoprotein complex subunit 2|nr:L30e-like protein [Neocallimastix sp. JGI-2020a]
MGKDGKVKKEKKSDAEDNYESRLSALNEISKPLASKKLNKKLLKTVRKASKAKDIKRGVKEVVKGLRKGNKGLVIIAGDISPIDVITHVPILCEESDVPYCYVPSKEDLGTAGSTKRPTSCVMIVKNKDAEYKDLYEECVSEVKEMEVEV